MATPSTLTSCGPPAWDFSSFRKRGAKMPEIRMNVSSKEERADNGWGRSSKKGRNKGKRPLCILKRERERERVGTRRRRRRRSPSLSPPQLHQYMQVSTTDYQFPQMRAEAPLFFILHPSRPHRLAQYHRRRTHTHTHIHIRLMMRLSREC